MKHLILLITVVTLLSSCSKDPVSSGSSEPVMYDCDTFFDSGDYSSLCFVGSEDLIVDIDNVSGTTCIAELGLLPDSVNDYVTISFFESAVVEGLPGQSLVTASVFASIKSDAYNTEDVSNLGNSAFKATDDSSSFLTRVQLYVRYSNLILTFDTSYENETGPHCANDHDELIKLARIVLTNLG